MTLTDTEMRLVAEKCRWSQNLGADIGDARRPTQGIMLFRKGTNKWELTLAGVAVCIEKFNLWTFSDENGWHIDWNHGNGRKETNDHQTLTDAVTAAVKAWAAQENQT